MPLYTGFYYSTTGCISRFLNTSKWLLRFQKAACLCVQQITRISVHISTISLYVSVVSRSLYWLCFTLAIWLVIQVKGVSYLIYISLPWILCLIFLLELNMHWHLLLWASSLGVYSKLISLFIWWNLKCYCLESKRTLPFSDSIWKVVTFITPFSGTSMQCLHWLWLSQYCSSMSKELPTDPKTLLGWGEYL